MQYHCLSIARKGGVVDLVGYDGMYSYGFGGVGIVAC